MKREISVLAIFVFLVACAMVLSGCCKKISQPFVETGTPEDNAAAEQEQAEKIGKPWIEVMVPGAFLVKSDEEKYVLLTGDELNEGEKVETDATGLANVYFPDGSVARMDSNTKIVILEGKYEYNSKSLKVRIMLSAGNLWSKIIKLATPESVWEVETSNAVAAVRGSAFGTSHLPKKTMIIGSEHTVTALPKNPANNEVIEDQRAVIGENQYIIIASENLSKYASNTRKIANDVMLKTKPLSREGWVSSSLKADINVNNRLEELVAGGMSDENSRAAYGQEMVTKFNPHPRSGLVPAAIISGPAQTSTAGGGTEQSDTVIAPPKTTVPATTAPSAGNTTSSTTSGSGTSVYSGGGAGSTGAAAATTTSSTTAVAPTSTNADATWLDIPVATDTSPNLGTYFLDETGY